MSQTARLIAQAGEPVSWLTPLGLPVIQPYHKSSRQMVCQTVLTKKKKKRKKRQKKEEEKEKEKKTDRQTDRRVCVF